MQKIIDQSKEGEILQYKKPDDFVIATGKQLNDRIYCGKGSWDENFFFQGY